MYFDNLWLSRLATRPIADKIKKDIVRLRCA